MAEIVLNAADMVVGRLASHAAKQALNGQSVKIINCEKAVMTGRKKWVFQHYAVPRAERGQIRHGPYIARQPDRFVRRIVRGMLPWSKTRGREAFKRVMCYIGVPPELTTAKVAQLEEGHTSKLSTFNYVTME